MTATIVLLSALSPLLVALIRRCAWPKPLVELLSVLVVAGLYIAGRWLDQALTWPLTEDFWVGLAAAWGVQQASYKFVLRGNKAVAELEYLER